MRGSIAFALVLCASVLAAQSCATPTSRVAAGEQIDAVTASPAQFRVVLENEHVRVIEYEIAPGQRDPWHTHPPKVSYIIAGGALRIHLQNGESFEVTEETGATHWAEALGVHSAENIGTTPVRVLIVEVKSAA